MAVRLTTVDNPYDPFTQWDEWYAYDEGKGYATSGLLARFVHTSDELSDETQEQDTEEAINTIMELFPDGFYKRVNDKR